MKPQSRRESDRPVVDETAFQQLLSAAYVMRAQQPPEKTYRTGCRTCYSCNRTSGSCSNHLLRQFHFRSAAGERCLHYRVRFRSPIDEFFCDSAAPLSGPITR